MNKLIGIFLSALFLVACNNSSNQQMVDLTPTTPVPSTTTSQPNKQTTTNTAPANSNNTDNGAINPKHGQPGHRCDIPEGAPLSSTPNNAGTSVPTVNPAPVLNTQPSLQPVNSNVRLNPEHGQPGHDCSIPVGQPLKSKS